MSNPLRGKYTALKQEQAERKLFPIFFHAIDRETGGSITRHGIPTNDGSFMYSDGTIDYMYGRKEIIHIMPENEVAKGKKNLFIRMFFKDASSVVRYEDGTVFTQVSHIGPTHIIRAGVWIESMNMVLPFDFIVTETYQSNEGISVTMIGKEAYSRMNHINRTKADSYDDVVRQPRLLPFYNTWKQDESEAMMKWNVYKEADAHVRVLKNNQ